MTEALSSQPPQSALATALANRYRIERELGAGGMATVYLAHDVKHDRNFGIALAAEQAGGQRMTQTGMSLGTPHYMSLDNGYAVAPDDRAFYFVKTGALAAVESKAVVTLNWFQELTRKAGK